MEKVKQLNKGNSAWNRVSKVVSSAKNKYEILPVDAAKATEVLKKSEIDVNTELGAVIEKTGGILIDEGWIRILGSGSNKMQRDVYSSGISIFEDPEYDSEEKVKLILVADDIVGGIFALNTGELGDDIGNIYYMSPDILDWDALEVSYLEFLEFCFSGDINEFYSNYLNLRWDNWQEYIKNISSDDVIIFEPALWEDNSDDLSERKKIIIPMLDVYDLYEAAREELFDGEDFLESDIDYVEYDGCSCGSDSSEDGCNCEDCDCEKND